MVRVISEKLFSPPRSRHSSGETTDKELAARAVEALSSLNSRRLELSDYESSSDSHWDSEVDVEGDGAESSIKAGAKNGGTVDVLRKRKERRRERNKVSAQAYRVRRKEQTVKQQTVLQSLQDENARLKSTVQSLEDEMLKVRNSLRQRGHLTSFALPSPAPTTPTPTPTPIPTTTPKTWTDKGSGSPSFGSVAGDKFASFGQLSEKTSTSGGACVLAMDNAQSRQQQISPVVDNFLFSKPLTTPPPTGAIKVPSGIPTFSFPSTSTSPIPVGGARHNFNATTGFVGSALPTISEKPDDHFSQHHQHHPYPKSQLQQQQQQYQQHQQQADLNANANANSFALNNNANMVHTKVGVFDMYNNSNRMNNNNHLFQNEEACGDRMAQQLPFKVC